MSWAYRVIRTLLPPERATNDERVCHQIAEVYFDDDGKPTGYGEAGDVFDCGDGTGDPIKELAWVVERYQQALTLPVIDFGEQSSSVRLPYDEWKALAAATTRADQAEALNAELAAALREVQLHGRLADHYGHCDRDGNAGRTCSACVDQRAVGDVVRAALARLDAAGGGDAKG